MRPTTRRQFLRSAATGAAAAALVPLSALGPLNSLAAAPAGAHAAGDAAEGKRRNVLFIAVDDLRPQLASFGHAKMISPHIDALAARGTALLRTYCQQAVCAPSRASVMSGCRPDTTRVYDLQTPLRTVQPDIRTLNQHFLEAGYATLSLGKIYHHAAKDDPKWTEPPQHAPGGFPGYVTAEALAILKEVNAADETVKTKGALGKKRGPPTECADVPDDAYADGKLAAMACAKLAECAKAGKPFFLAVGFYKPHLAFACPKKYWDMYDRSKIDLADNPFQPRGAPDIAMHNWGELRAYHGVPQDGPLSDDAARELIHGYYACTSFIDAQIGRVLDALDREGLRESTVVVLWGDHGWHLGDHGLWCKHSNFETATHAPLVVASPDSPGGRKTTRLAEFVDIYPTVCELAGLPVPEHCEGVSLVPLMKDPDRPWKTAAFSQYPRGRVMGHTMRTDRYRLTRWLGKDGAVAGTELYDHEKDPHENVNVADDAAYADDLKALLAQFAAGWKGARPKV
jgi:arylsulfatase A-like enzyme